MKNEIEQIMQPYFDIKDIIKNDPKSIENESTNIGQNLSELREKRLSEKRLLEARLNKLRENRDKEIEEFINGTDSYFYAGHAATIRKDLELAYKDKEEELENQIKNLSKKSDEELNLTEQKNLVSSKTDFRSRAYIRKTINIKEDIRKKLIAKQKEIEIMLSKEKLNFDSAMLDLSQFKYTYDENYNPTNASEWKNLYQKSTDSSDKMTSLRNQLEQIKKYLKVTELTEEEIKIVMTSITPQEKAILQELEQQEKNKTIEPTPIVSDPIGNSQTEPTPQLREFNYNAADVSYNNDVVTEPDYVEKGNKIEVDTRADLVKLIYNDVMKTIESTDTVTLHDSKGDLGDAERYIGINNEIKGTVFVDDMALPNGEYVNSADFENALNKYVNKSKGKTYVVKERNDKLRMTNVEKFKKALNNSSILLFGKRVASKFAVRGREQAADQSRVLGEVRGEAKQGKYISRNELIRNLNELFEKKSANWIKNFAFKLKDKVSQLNKKEPKVFEDIYSSSNFIEDDEHRIKPR